MPPSLLRMMNQERSEQWNGISAQVLKHPPAKYQTKTETFDFKLSADTKYHFKQQQKKKHNKQHLPTG